MGTHHLRLLTGVAVALFALPAAAAEAPVTLGLEAEDFQFPGDWSLESGTPAPSGRGWLFSGLKGARLPAATAVQIPRAGRYYLWVRARDFPDDRPGKRRFTVAVGTERSTETFGKSNRADWTWEPGGAFDLPAGPVLISLHDVDHLCARADAVLLTTDPAFTPTEALGRPGHPRVAPLTLPLPPEADPLRAGPVRDLPGAPVARLENEFLRLEFLPALRDGKQTLRPRFSFRRDG
ncbi:MAG: hypothetical protein QHJ73_17575, partial [Armatimonadota bacterium]|nr:hypothetical protein [Armatimonadota bacterium]